MLVLALVPAAALAESAANQYTEPIPNAGGQGVRDAGQITGPNNGNGSANPQPDNTPQPPPQPSTPATPTDTDDGYSYVPPTETEDVAPAPRNPATKGNGGANLPPANPTQGLPVPPASGEGLAAADNSDGGGSSAPFLLGAVALLASISIGGLALKARRSQPSAG